MKNCLPHPEYRMWEGESSADSFLIFKTNTPSRRTLVGPAGNECSPPGMDGEQIEKLRWMGMKASGGGRSGEIMRGIIQNKCSGVKHGSLTSLTGPTGLISWEAGAQLAPADPRGLVEQRTNSPGTGIRKTSGQSGGKTSSAAHQAHREATRGLGTLY